MNKKIHPQDASKRQRRLDNILKEFVEPNLLSSSASVPRRDDEGNLLYPAEMALDWLQKGAAVKRKGRTFAYQIRMIDGVACMTGIDEEGKILCFTSLSGEDLTADDYILVNDIGIVLGR